MLWGAESEAFISSKMQLLIYPDKYIILCYFALTIPKEVEDGMQFNLPSAAMALLFHVDRHTFVLIKH